MLLIGCSALGLHAQPIPEDLDAERDPLGNPTGRLNHPVLLIHGWMDDATAFGVDLAEPICRNPVVLRATSTFDVEELKPLLVQMNPRPSPIHMKTRLVLRCSDGWEPQVDRSDLIGRARNVWEAKQIMQTPITHTTNSTRVGDRTFLWPNWAMEFEGLKISEIDSLVPYHVQRALYHSDDLLMWYQAGSIPDVLSRSFQLDTRWDPNAPRRGINRNGIYAYHAKSPRSEASEICRDATLEASRVEVGWENTGRIAIPATKVMGIETPELAIFKLVLVVERLRVECHDPGRIATNYVSYAPFSVAFPDVKPSTDPSSITFKPLPPEQWQVKLDARKRIIVASALTNPGTPSDISFSVITRDYSAEEHATFRTTDSIQRFAPETLPGWDNDGQAKQLHDRIRQVLDDHYGAGKWESDPTAQIDLIAHSQGGLVVRAMLAEPAARTDLALSNPLRHIRRVVTLGTPHFGTAIATQESFLRLPQSALRADLGQRPFPEVANLKTRLDATSACHLPMPVLGQWSATLESIRAREHFHEAPPPGCLALRGNLGYTEARGLFSSSKSAGMYLTGPLTGPWNLSIIGLPESVPDKTIGANGMQSLMERITAGSHLGWPQSSSFIANLLQNDAAYPQYPGSSTKIPFFTFHSPSVGAFGADLFRAAIRNLKEGCPLPPPQYPSWVQPSILAYGENYGGSMTISCRSFHSALDEWQTQAETQFAPFDADWSTAGDMIVEEPSQKGEQNQIGPVKVAFWDNASTPEFNPTRFQQRSVFHGSTIIRMAFDNLDPNMSGVSWHLRAPALDFTPPSGPMQGCDIATRGLGVSYPTTCPPTLPFRDRVSLPPVIRTQPAGLPSGAWALVLTNPSAQPWKPGWILELPIVASARPTPTLEGAAPSVVEPLGDRLWAARWTFTTPVAPGAAASGDAPWIVHPGPSAEFLESAADSIDSIPHLVALRTVDDILVSGSDLSAASSPTPASFEVHVSRGNGDAAWLRPVVDLVNTSLDTLHAATIRFRLPSRDGATLEAVLWSVPWPSQGSLSLVADATGEWVVDVRLTGLQLAPGQTLSGLQWGAHWDDWVLWTQPSLPATPKVVDWAIGVISPMVQPEQSVPPSVTTDLHAHIRRDNSEANLHRFRLKVSAPTARTGFTLRLPIEVPEGITPILEPWWPTGCTGTLETEAMTLRCPEAMLSPETPWPDAIGASIGLHDTNWQPWPQGTTGITAVGAEWTEVSP